MTAIEEKILYIGTHGGESPEKAAMPFVMANAALAMDIKATVVLQGNGVYLARKGYVDNMLPSGGFPPMAKLMKVFSTREAGCWCARRASRSARSTRPRT